jgi:hypothetical protein
VSWYLVLAELLLVDVAGLCAARASVVVVVVAVVVAAAALLAEDALRAVLGLLVEALLAEARRVDRDAQDGARGRHERLEQDQDVHRPHLVPVALAHRQPTRLLPLLLPLLLLLRCLGLGGGGGLLLLRFLLRRRLGGRCGLLGCHLLLWLLRLLLFVVHHLRVGLGRDMLLYFHFRLSLLPLLLLLLGLVGLFEDVGVELVHPAQPLRGGLLGLHGPAQRVQLDCSQS